MRILGILFVVAASVPSGGCCNLARYLCGPDESVWVSERFDTPSATIASFREAVRRADSLAVHRTLSESYKEQTGLIGRTEAVLAWRRIQELVPGVHVLGYADVSDLRVVRPDYVEATLSIAGRRIQLDLVRQPYWEIRWIYDGDPDEIEREGRYVQSLRGLGRLEVDDQELTLHATVRLPPLDAEIDDLDQVQSAGIGFEWKVNAIRELSETDSGDGS